MCEAPQFVLVEDLVNPEECFKISDAFFVRSSDDGVHQVVHFNLLQSVRSSLVRLADNLVRRLTHLDEMWRQQRSLDAVRELPRLFGDVRFRDSDHALMLESGRRIHQYRPFIVSPNLAADDSA